MLSALRRFRREQGETAARRVASRFVEKARKTLAAAEETDRTEVVDPGSIRHVGRDSGRVVTVALIGSGALADVDFDRTWVSARLPESITQRVNEAIVDAKSVMAAATPSSPRAGMMSTSPAADPDALIYKFAQ
jgi:DNA-binding protein YbaB